MLFDCGHDTESGKMTARGALCLSCAVIPASDNRVVVRRAPRRTRGEIADAERKAYEMYKARLPDYADDKLMTIARVFVRTQIKGGVIQ